MIRTCKQLQKALREANNDMKLIVEKSCGMYRVSYGSYRLSCYTLKDLNKKILLIFKLVLALALIIIYNIIKAKA